MNSYKQNTRFYNVIFSFISLLWRIETLPVYDIPDLLSIWILDKVNSLKFISSLVTYCSLYLENCNCKDRSWHISKKISRERKRKRDEESRRGIFRKKGDDGSTPDE